MMEEPIATRSQIREAFARLDLRWFDAEHGSCSGETAQKMHRMEASIALERLLFWGERDRAMDELVAESQRLGLYDDGGPKAA